MCVPIERTVGHSNIVLRAALDESISDDWEIRDARAFRVNPNGRHPVTYEGPFRQDLGDSAPLVSQAKWHLYDMRDEAYEVEIQLHRKSERLTFSDTRNIIVAGKGIAVRCAAIKSD